MLTADLATEQVQVYRDRLNELYCQVRGWVADRRPGTTFSESTVALSEESTGAYGAVSLDFVYADAGGIRLIPRGIFMVGAQGRVDVRSKLGRQMLVWVRSEGPSVTTAVADSASTSDEIAISRPLFPDVPQGWAWTDDRRNRLVHLNEAIFWDHVMASLID